MTHGLNTEHELQQYYNKYVFKAFLNWDRLLHSLTLQGNSFHMRGATLQKVLRSADLKQLDSIRQSQKGSIGWR